MNNAKKEHISEEERANLRAAFNARIAHGCSFVALVVILVDLAAFVIGQADEFFMLAGIMIAVALLAIAMLYNPTTFQSKNAKNSSTKK
jgi:uncharacterized membrane protein